MYVGIRSVPGEYKDCWINRIAVLQFYCESRSVQIDPSENFDSKLNYL